MPSAAARAFMRSTIASHEPAACSATATAASFALWTMSAKSMSSSVKVSFGSRNTWEPPVLNARTDTATRSASLSSPRSTASITSSRSIILTMLAGRHGVSAASSKSTRPLSASNAIAPR